MSDLFSIDTIEGTFDDDNETALRTTQQFHPRPHNEQSTHHQGLLLPQTGDMSSCDDGDYFSSTELLPDDDEVGDMFQNILKPKIIDNLNYREPHQDADGGSEEKDDEFEDGDDDDEFEDALTRIVSLPELDGNAKSFTVGSDANISSNATVLSDVEDDEDDIDIDTLPVSEGAIPHPSYDLTQSLIAQKMSQLSMKEREQVYYDVHGVHDAVDETAEDGQFVNRKLGEMAQQLLKLKPDDRAAYDMARDVNLEYVEDKDFRLRFLRADRFDPKLAADRYARHFQVKLELFGKEKLGRDIVQDDLCNEALDSLYCGMSQTLPQRDAAGRLIWIWIGGRKQQSFSKDATMQRIFYKTMLMSEDVETQRKGTVSIVYALKQQQTRRGSEGRDTIRNVTSLAKALPVSVTSCHFCYDNYAWLPVFSIIQLSAYLFIRLRIRLHYGPHSECMYKLQTFGIPVDRFPIDENGTVSVEHHQTSLKKRRAQEREWEKKDGEGSQELVRISVPTRFDVLLGRGRGYFNHVGNVRYRVLIEDLKDRYDKASGKGKTKLTADVVATVHEFGGRFLKDDGGVWIQIDDESARKKCGHSFRALRSSSTQNGKTSKEGRAKVAQSGSMDDASIRKRTRRT